MTEHAASTAKATAVACPPSSQLAAIYENPYPLFSDLRNTAPVMEGDVLSWWGLPSQAGYVPGRPIYTLFRYRDIMSVLRDGETFTSGIIKEGLGDVLGSNVITGLDGEPHRRLRGLLASCFSRAALTTWNKRFIEPVVRDELVKPLAQRRDKKSELVADIAHYPMRVIYEILGFPNEPDQIRQFAEWGLMVKEAMRRDAGEEPLQAAQKLYDYILPIVASRRAEEPDGDDLIAKLLRAKFEGHALDDHNITQMVRMLVTAAVETTSISFQNMMTLLLTRPEVLERARKDRSLVSKTLDEVLRFESPASFHARQASRDVVVGGVEIPAGSALSLAAGSGSRDEEVFENGDSFDIDREKRPHLGFGFGPHMCIGQHGARYELAAALNSMLDLMPNLRLDPEHEPPKIEGVIKQHPSKIHVVWD